MEFLDGGKWKYIFQSYFWKHGAVNECYGSIDISFQMRGGGGGGGGGGGRVSLHPRSGKAEVVSYSNLYVNKHVTCDFKISSPVTVSLL